ncbi:MAG: hypothetical protein QOE70_922 [Chthoniobacter sp.]|jgi:hypothetical protein|nr:hypothetical protein [Chthoniobacter sp.]
MRHLFKPLIFTGALSLVATFVALQSGASKPSPAKRLVSDLYHRIADQSWPLFSQRQGQLSAQPESAGEVDSVKALRHSQAAVRVPAIRGENNYGWVQLPYGTTVELVRDEGASLLVRWDGNTVRVLRGSATDGLVVLRKGDRRPFTG